MTIHNIKINLKEGGERKRGWREEWRKEEKEVGGQEGGEGVGERERETFLYCHPQADKKAARRKHQPSV